MMATGERPAPPVLRFQERLVVRESTAPPPPPAAEATEGLRHD
jgi:hypothetical protein